MGGCGYEQKTEYEIHHSNVGAEKYIRDRTEGVDLSFDPGAIEAIADIAVQVNDTVENIGARRLHTVLERVLDEISFSASERNGEAFAITGAYVREKLSAMAGDKDLSKYIL